MSNNIPKEKDRKPLEQFESGNPPVVLWGCDHCQGNIGKVDDSDYCEFCGIPSFSQRLKEERDTALPLDEDWLEIFEPDQPGVCRICDNNPDNVESEFCPCGQVSRWHMNRTYAEEAKRNPFILL